MSSQVSSLAALAAAFVLTACAEQPMFQTGATLSSVPPPRPRAAFAAPAPAAPVVIAAPPPAPPSAAAAPASAPPAAPAVSAPAVSAPIGPSTAPIDQSEAAKQLLP